MDKEFVFNNHPKPHRLVGLAVILAVAGCLMVIALLWPKHQENNGVYRGREYIATTPPSYQSFIGTVVSVEADGLVVKNTTIHDNGQKVDRLVSAKVGPHTVIQSVAIVNNREQKNTLTLADFSATTKVEVVGTENLATITSFTATLINRIDY